MEKVPPAIESTSSRNILHDCGKLDSVRDGRTPFPPIAVLTPCKSKCKKDNNEAPIHNPSVPPRLDRRSMIVTFGLISISIVVLALEAYTSNLVLPVSGWSSEKTEVVLATISSHGTHFRHLLHFSTHFVFAGAQLKRATRFV